jgi:hypothetical protein
MLYQLEYRIGAYTEWRKSCVPDYPSYGDPSYRFLWPSYTPFQDRKLPLFGRCLGVFDIVGMQFGSREYIQVWKSWAEHCFNSPIREETKCGSACAIVVPELPTLEPLRSTMTPHLDIVAALYHIITVSEDIDKESAIYQKWEAADKLTTTTERSLAMERLIQDNDFPEILWAYNYSPIRINTGYHGLVEAVTEDVRPGDWVVIAAGSDSPLVIRPAGDSFHYVGHAFVPGIMCGETWHEEGMPDALPFERPSKLLELEKADVFWLV